MKLSKSTVSFLFWLWSSSIHNSSDNTIGLMFAHSFVVTTTTTTTATTSTTMTPRKNVKISNSVLSSATTMYYDQEGDESNTNSVDKMTDTKDDASSAVLKTITSPVLQQVYPELVEHKKEYGHPNIPLGSKAGRQCQTLRRLHIQNKLTAEEVELLESLGFTFHSLEDVYRYADFDDLFQRMMNYEANHPNNNFQIPKKCPEDPELGAWVTGIRRLGKDGVNPQHERRLDDVGFAWKSTRKCGSKFMDQYREWTQKVEALGLDAVLQDPQTVLWVKAQQEALKRGTLSQTRVHYMGQLFGDQWTTIGNENISK